MLPTVLTTLPDLLMMVIDSMIGSLLVPLYDYRIQCGVTEMKTSFEDMDIESVCWVVELAVRDISS